MSLALIIMYGSQVFLVVLTVMLPSMTSSWHFSPCKQIRDKIEKATEQYISVVLFIMLCKVVLDFESVDKILKCDHSNESY